MGITVGIHLIWTTYGTWLPGDPSKPGHWSPLFDVYGRLKRSGHRLNVPDPVTYAHARSLMNEPAKTLSDDERRMVANVIGVYLAPALAGANCEAPGKPGAKWGEKREIVRAYACAIEPTHVHLLVGPVREDIGRFVGRLKGAASSALLTLPCNRGRTRIWTAGYWKVFLFDHEAFHAVRTYVERHNIRSGRPVSPYEWLSVPDGSTCDAPSST